MTALGGGETLADVLVLSLYAAILILGIVSAWFLLTERIAAVAALVAVIVYGALLEIVCVVFLLRWWHLVPGVMTALRTGIPFVLADAMILLALFGRRVLLAGRPTRMLWAGFWCAVGSLLGFLQLFMGSGY